MKYINKILLVCVICLTQSIDASYYRTALLVVKKISGKAKEVVQSHTNKFRNNNETRNVTTKFQNENSVPHAAQAVKSDAEQTATASGFLNFSKNSTESTNNNTYHYNFAKKTFSESFFTWIENGKQVRSAGVGFLFGGITGCGVHAFVAPYQKEKNIVNQG